MLTHPSTDTPVKRARADFYERLKPHNLSPLWEVLSGLVIPEPRTPAVPFSWNYQELRPLLHEAGRLISAAEAERRVLILENPGMPQQSAITSTLYAGLQLILPGEFAPAHRHTQSALRFIMDGAGAYTALNGERTIMQRYDLVLTPNWAWHDHGNETDEPMTWLDGLDVPLIRSLDAGFAEHSSNHGPRPRSNADGYAQIRWGSNLRPARTSREEVRTNPLFAYSHSVWRKTLDGMASAGAPHAHDAYRMEFANPADGGPVLSTMSAFAQLVPTGLRMQPSRSSDSTVHVVTEGHGVFEIEDKTFEVSEGSIVVVPTWAKRRIEATDDLVIFSYSDKATLSKLGLWREELL